MWKQFTVASALMALSACGAELGVADQTSSSFGAASNFGGVPSSGITSNTRSGGGAGVGYGWVVGGGPTGGFAGAAGLTSGPFAIGGAPSGVVTYSGSYQMGVVENIFLDGDVVRGTSNTLSGPINLIANVGAGTLQGAGRDLEVNGTINGTSLGGSVTFMGSFGNTSGPLDGVIGSQAAIGAFHGNDSTTVFAGGFNVRD